MNLYALIFYILAAVVLTATSLALTRRQLMHAVVYLVLSFFGTAQLLYLLGAPFLAVLEVIIYAGGIMVLFLFIVMMLEIRPSEEPVSAYLRRWLPAALMGAVCLAVAFILIIFQSGSGAALPLSAASPLEFGRFLYQQYWLAVEIVSLLLFAALVGALYLGRREE